MSDFMLNAAYQGRTYRVVTPFAVHDFKDFLPAKAFIETRMPSNDNSQYADLVDARWGRK
jgi:hypothetical protein